MLVIFNVRYCLRIYYPKTIKIQTKTIIIRTSFKETNESHSRIHSETVLHLQIECLLINPFTKKIPVINSS